MISKTRDYTLDGPRLYFFARTMEKLLFGSVNAGLLFEHVMLKEKNLSE